jgi:PAS domain S-box-containing protein
VSRKLILLAILAVVGTAELLVMVVFYYLGIRTGSLASLVDTAVLVAISAPLLHLVLLRSERAVREGKELARAYQSLKGLYDLADALKQANNEQDVLKNTLQQVMKFPGVQAGWVSLREGETGFRLAAADGLPPALEVPGAFEGECLCRRKLLAGELDRKTNILECERLRQAKGDTRGLRLHASVPLWIGNRVIGVMNLAGPEQGLFGDKDLEILYSVGNQVAVALERTHLLQEMETIVEERTAALTAEIAERQQAEEKLRQSEEQFRSLFSHSPLLMWVLDLETLRFLEVNDAVIAHYGYSREEFLAMGMDNIRLPEQATSLSEIIEQIRADGKSYTDCLQVLKMGGIIELEIYWQALEFGGRNAVLAVAQDITVRRRAEEEKARLLSILDVTTDLVGIADIDLNLIYLNSGGRKMLGAGHDEDLLGHSIGQYHAEWARALVVEEGIPAAIRDGVWRGETAFLAPTGQEIPTSQVILAHKAPGGTVQFFSTIVRDNSEQKRLENQFRQAQKMEAVGRLAGGVAHDFNNLLGVIIGYSELVEELLKPDDPLRPKINEIKKAGQRGASLTRQLLAFSRQQVLEPKILNLNSVVADVQKMLQRVIGEDIELITNCQPNLALVNADQGQIEQVIMNLAVNSRDAMPNGGKLRIETANVDLDEFYARQHAPLVPGSYVMLVVTDTGMGMDAETQTHIFEPFFTTKELGKGTGLGLATVYGIVKQSGGYVWVYSELGQGTTFKIYLSQVQGEVEKEQPSIGPDKLVKRTETILLVEDEEALRKMTCELLVESGYTVLEAGDGLEALEIAQRHKGPIHLLLTDVVMPRMGGPALAKPAAVLHPELKVLYMSGYTGYSSDNQALVNSASELLQKPFTRDVLLRKIREMLGV